MDVKTIECLSVYKFKTLLDSSCITKKVLCVKTNRPASAAIPEGMARTSSALYQAKGRKEKRNTHVINIGVRKVTKAGQPKSSDFMKDMRTNTVDFRYASVQNMLAWDYTST